MKLDNNKWRLGSVLSPRARLVTNMVTGKIHIIVLADNQISEPFTTAMAAIKAWGSGNYNFHNSSTELYR